MKLRDPPLIWATVICRKDPSVFDGLYRRYTRCRRNDGGSEVNDALPTYSKALCEQHLGEKGWFYSEATPPIKESREQRVSRRAGTAAIIVGIAASLLTLPQLGEIWKPSGAQTTGERLAWAAFTIILWVLFFWFRRIRTAPSPRGRAARAFIRIVLG